MTLPYHWSGQLQGEAKCSRANKARKSCKYKKTCSNGKGKQFSGTFFDSFLPLLLWLSLLQYSKYLAHKKRMRYSFVIWVWFLCFSFFKSCNKNISTRQLYFCSFLPIYKAVLGGRVFTDAILADRKVTLVSQKKCKSRFYPLFSYIIFERHFHPISFAGFIHVEIPQITNQFEFL